MLSSHEARKQGTQEVWKKEGVFYQIINTVVTSILVLTAVKQTTLCHVIKRLPNKNMGGEPISLLHSKQSTAFLNIFNWMSIKIETL